MKQTKEDKMIAEAYYKKPKIDPHATEVMSRIQSDLDKLYQMLNNPNVSDDTKAAIENFFYNIKEYPI